MTYAELVEQLVARTGISRDRAERIARDECRQRGEPVPDPNPIAERDAHEIEKFTQAQIIKRLRGFGFRVYSLSQPRAAKQTPGLPDLWAMHERLPVAFWWESKRPVGGRYSDEQLEFAKLAIRGGVRYGSGDLNDCDEYLIGLGLAERSGGHLEPSALLRASREAAPDDGVLSA